MTGTELQQWLEREGVRLRGKRLYGVEGARLLGISQGHMSRLLHDRPDAPWTPLLSRSVEWAEGVIERHPDRALRIAAGDWDGFTEYK